MKLDPGQFGEGAARRASLPRRFIERRMRALAIRPLDHADHTIGLGVVAAIGFISIFALFGAFAPISGAATASGTVAVTGDTFDVQPAGAGIVSQVMVHEGQAVRAGQPLVRLNGVRSGASLKQAEARHDALEALEARLVAERDGAAALAFPPDLRRRAAEPSAAHAMASQQAIFARHAAVLGADRGTSEQELIAAQAKQTASVRELGLIRDQLADYRKLYADGFARLSTLRDLERQEAGLAADAAAGGASLKEAQIARDRVTNAQALDTQSQLAQAQEQLAQINPSLDVTRYFADQDLLRAPTAGHVSGIVEMGPGMVVSGGRTLMQLVPAGRPLIVDVQVQPADIDDVKLGQEAIVRFTTVNPHGKNSFKGHVVTLSPAQVIGGAGKPYFKAQVSLDDPAGARRAGLVLQPGIPASVNIKTHDRSLFSYLFSPLADALSRSNRQQ